MDRDDFWKIIESCRDTDQPEVALRAALDPMDAAELQSFQEHFDDLFYSADRWDLWGAAYIMGGGCSDDGFMDFRYWLISQGKDICEGAIADPDSLADLGKIDDSRNEAFGYVADKVYESKTGQRMPYPGTTYPDVGGEEWDFDDWEEFQRRLPKLAKRYSE